MMEDIAIYGAGGLGREVACLINRLNCSNPKWNFIGFFDDGKEVGQQISHFGINLGGINELNNWRSDLNVVLAFGNPKTSRLVKEAIVNPLIDFPNLIDPSTQYWDSPIPNIGKGNIIQSGCIISTEVTIGSFNLFNGNISIGHDSNIGNFNVFMPACRISGEVSIKDGNLFGAECFIKQQLKIGNNITVSPLSALLSNPKDGNVYIGNPAKLFRF